MKIIQRITYHREMTNPQHSVTISTSILHPDIVEKMKPLVPRFVKLVIGSFNDFIYLENPDNSKSSPYDRIDIWYD